MGRPLPPVAEDLGGDQVVAEHLEAIETLLL
jgi:hypothetical protein